jgi:hypothetical protein
MRYVHIALVVRFEISMLVVQIDYIEIELIPCLKIYVLLMS